MSFLVATNIVASWPPERRPTGTPHARANTLGIPIKKIVGEELNLQRTELNIIFTICEFTLLKGIIFLELYLYNISQLLMD